MAIIVEEEKKSNSWILSLATWLVIVGAIAAGAYFVFFKRPQLVEKIGAPSQFTSTDQLSKIELQKDVNDVVASLSAVYKVNDLAGVQIKGKGRPNPFLSF